MAEIESVQRYNARLTLRNKELMARNGELLVENAKLKRQIDAYVCELRVCRFCSHFHEDCSPTDGSCRPHWRGL